METDEDAEAEAEEDRAVSDIEKDVEWKDPYIPVAQKNNKLVKYHASTEDSVRFPEQCVECLAWGYWCWKQKTSTNGRMKNTCVECSFEHRSCSHSPLAPHTRGRKGKGKAKEVEKGGTDLGDGGNRELVLVLRDVVSELAEGNRIQRKQNGLLERIAEFLETGTD